MLSRSMVAMNPELTLSDPVLPQSKTTNADLAELVGTSRFKLSLTPYTNMMQDILGAILGTLAFVAIWIMAACL